MHIDWLIYGLLFLLALDAFFLKAHTFEQFLNWWKKYVTPYIHWLFIIPLIFFGSVFVLSLSNQSWLPLNTLLTTAKENGELTFPLIEHLPYAVALLIKLLVATYPFVVSLHPLLWILIFLNWVFILKHRSHTFIVFLTLFVSFFSLAYFATALAAGVLTNVRYSILLYPLFALLLAISLDTLSSFSRYRYTPLILSLCILFGLSITLYQTKPFYLNYTSPLVSHTLAPHDAWGYGQYEAAQFLNALPNHDQVLIWSDRNGVCQFLSGPRCISGYKIDLTQTQPDYFVVSKRGVERGYVPRDKATGAILVNYPTLYADALWRLNILDRPDNFILIVPADTK